MPLTDRAAVHIPVHASKPSKDKNNGHFTVKRPLFFASLKGQTQKSAPQYVWENLKNSGDPENLQRSGDLHKSSVCALRLHFLLPLIHGIICPAEYVLYCDIRFLVKIC